MSIASTISAFAPLAIRPSMSASCFSGEPPASALMYLAPSFSSCALIAASSVFQRSSWKFDQLTPTTVCASAPKALMPSANAVRVRISVICVLSSVGCDSAQMLGRAIRDCQQQAEESKVSFISQEHRRAFVRGFRSKGRRRCTARAPRSNDERFESSPKNHVGGRLLSAMRVRASQPVRPMEPRRERRVPAFPC